VLLNREFESIRDHMGETAIEIDCTFDPDAGPHAMAHEIARIQREAEDAVRGGCTHVILSDTAMGPARAPLPMILAAGAVHTHLVQSELRTFTSINVRTAECLDVHYFAVLVGVGATTINPWLAQAAIADRHRRGLFGALALDQSLRHYKQAVDDGLLKVMSKMGISVISSYRGGYNFEAVGLSRSLVAEFYPGLPSRISGIGLHGIQRKVAAQHARGFREDAIALPVGGNYRYRRGATALTRSTPKCCRHCRRSTCATCWVFVRYVSRCRRPMSSRSPRSASGSSRRQCRWVP
jgi:glutamate synthase (NADPH/NADH) large chain